MNLKKIYLIILAFSILIVGFGFLTEPDETNIGIWYTILEFSLTSLIISGFLFGIYFALRDKPKKIAN